ncbi:MAG: DUF664 domain-containing protein [Candidatus Heimdallarchaeota archaeon]|nr:DUF664 domain-containing protein [Candidatus Heimdallarchaeota archaeon]
MLFLKKLSFSFFFSHHICRIYFSTVVTHKIKNQLFKRDTRLINCGGVEIMTKKFPQIEIIQDLYQYLFDVRRKLLDAVEQIPVKNRIEDINLSWKSIHGTLLHMIETEEYWIANIIQFNPIPTDQYEERPTIAQLRDRWRISQERTEAFLAGLTAENLAEKRTVTWPDGTHEFTIKEILLHVATHETHHRGQIIAGIRQQGFEPPKCDLL